MVRAALASRATETRLAGPGRRRGPGARLAATSAPVLLHARSAVDARDPPARSRSSSSAPTSCGSIPVGVLVARLTGGVDPRTSAPGGPAGRTRCGRSAASWAAVVVDGRPAQGARAGRRRARRHRGDPVVEVLCGLAAVAGAIWSVFVGFRSGRGVGTGVGTMLVIQPRCGAPGGAGVRRRDPDDPLRLARVAARVGRAVPGDAADLGGRVRGVPPPYLVYTVVGPRPDLVAHADNIDRLIHGTERKFDLGMLTGGRVGGSGGRGRALTRGSGPGRRAEPPRLPHTRQELIRMPACERAPLAEPVDADVGAGLSTSSGAVRRDGAACASSAMRRAGAETGASAPSERDRSRHAAWRRARQRASPPRSFDPGRLTTRVGISRWFGGPWAARAERMGSRGAAAHRSGSNREQ